jgi:glutaminyl-tRNA synthetase
MIRTRFPPEPNGYLHLGHVKSMFFNFNYPQDNGGGECILRLDDTNPETEKQNFVDNIIDNVVWLGYVPSNTTYTSDYFDELYAFAIQMINMGKAYIDESSSEEIKLQRSDKKKSPHRNRTIDDNLRLFDDMKEGKLKSCLRLKINSNNSCMQDPIAYRVKNTPHYRVTGWCIYPSYDFSHCIVDSIEGITHSFCTMEFSIRRELYYWILDTLQLRKPIVKEFNRLEIDFGVLSKRKIKKLVEDGSVDGWDDPRLITINGLRNKGYSPEMLKLFCAKLGYTQNVSSSIKKSLFDSVIREYMNKNAYRCFGIINPLKVIIENFDDDEKHVIKRPNHPQNETKGYSEIILRKIVYIESEDFRVSANKKYYRLKPGKSVRLKYGGIITYMDHHIHGS